MFKNSMQKKLRSRFYVTPKFGFGPDFDGILISSDKGEDGYSVFTDVTAHPEQGNPEQIKGDLYIMNAHVATSQSVG